MKKIICGFALASVCLLLMVSHVSAAGFALPEQGAAAMGMGSAFVGQADDASAVWYNPAGITQLDGINLMGGAVLIYPTFSHDNMDGTTNTASRASHMPALMYTTYKLNDMLTFGFGVNNPFGLATDWHLNSETSQVALLSQIISTEFNPNIAVKLTDKLSIAAGVAYVYLAATLSSALPIPNTQLRLTGSGDGWGGNVALLYKATDQLNLGLSYRSRIKVNIDGTAAVSGLLNMSNPATTSITLPDLLQFGSSFKATDKLTLNMDIGYTWWSTYDQLELASATFTALGKPNPLVQQKQWNDVWNVRIGSQYKVTDRWKLRAGLQYDKNPVPDHFLETRVPDSDRIGVSIGTGYTFRNITMDVAYLYLKFLTRNIGDSGQDDGTTSPHSLNGTYKTEAHVIGLSVAYKF